MNSTLRPYLLKTALIVTALAMGSMTTNTVFAQNEDNPLIVEADESLQWLRAENQYIATGNASAKQGDLLLTANVITADYTTEQTDDDKDASAITFIRGEKNATLIRATLTATAGVISYDITSERVELSGGNPQVINGEDRINASDTIIYDRTSRNITATGQAKIRLSNGRELHGDEIIIVLTNDEGDIEIVTATGQATVLSPAEDGGQQAYAEKMVYTRATGIAVLTGDVRVEDNNNILTGNRAEIDTINGTSIMSAATNGGRVGGVLNPAQ